MPPEDLLLYVLRASRSQVRICVAVSASLLIATLVCLPFARVPLPRFDSFVPMVTTVILLGDAITAALLFTQATILRSRALVVLACGYLYSGLIIMPYALSFPGSFTVDGLLGGGASTTAWLYIFWHAGLPISAIFYALLQKEEARGSSERSRRPSRVAIGVGMTILLVTALTLLATIGRDLLPALWGAGQTMLVGRVHMAAAVVLTLLLIAMALVWRGNRSLLDLWLLVALWAWALEAVVIIAVTARFSVGFYAGRIVGMLSGVFVLLALLVETSRLYTQLALSAIMRRQQIEGRLMSLDTVAASIAHQVKQPMAAMVSNAGAALIRLQRPVPDIEQVARTLRNIVEDGHRAAEVVTSIRSMFGVDTEARQEIDLHDLIRDTLALLAVELATARIEVGLALCADPPVIVANRVQMQQVLLNVVTNAIEALSEQPAGPRRLKIGTASSADDRLHLEVADSGVGISPEQAGRIFDAFFTTKSYGTGMGLPVCRTIVETHGGRMRVSANEPHGAVFHIELPRTEA